MQNVKRLAQIAQRSVGSSEILDSKCHTPKRIIRTVIRMVKI